MDLIIWPNQVQVWLIYIILFYQVLILIFIIKSAYLFGDNKNLFMD